MTTIAISHTAPARLSAARSLTVARLLLTNLSALIGWPLAIMGSSFIINVAIAAGIRDLTEEPTTGGLASLYIMQMVVCWQLLHQYFSFTVGLNVSRRVYYGGVALVALGQSLLFGLFVYGGAAVEHATGGWGVGLAFFDPLPITHGPWLVTLLVFTVPFIMLSCLGFFFGSITKRWGGTGVFLLTVIATLGLGGVAVLISYFDAWPEVGAWLATRSWRAIAAGWSLIPAALAAAAGYAVIRRAVP
jgi:hypothetical protein